MTFLQRDRTPILATLIVLGCSFLAYYRLPDWIPVHWGIAGRIDRELPRHLGAYLYPAAMALIYIFFRLVPFADRNRVRQLREIGIYDLLRNGAVLLFGYGQVLVLGIGLGWVSREANFLVGAAALLIALWADYVHQRRPHSVVSALVRAGFESGPEAAVLLARYLKVAAAVSMAGSLTGRWQVAWLTVPLLSAVALSRLKAASHRNVDS